MTCHGESDLAGGDEAACRLHAGDRAALDTNARDFTLLDQIDAARIGRARVTPCDRVVASGAAARLKQAAEHREARLSRAVEIRNATRDLLAGEKLRIDPIQAHRVAAAHRRIDVRRRMAEVEHAARTVHHVEVELARKPFPELERHLVEIGVRVEMVVRSDDGGVAAGVAAAEIPFVEHGDVGEAVLFREIVGGGQAVPAAADDDRIVTGFGRGAAPRLRPALVVRERVAHERKDRILHGLRVEEAAAPSSLSLARRIAYSSGLACSLGLNGRLTRSFRVSLEEGSS